MAEKELNEPLVESSIENETLSDSKKEVSEETAQEDLVRKCTAYWDEIQKLNSGSVGYFNTVFLPKALANPALPEQNRKFLLALKEYLNKPAKEIHAILATEQVLLPIFKLEKQELGIIGFPAHDYNSLDYVDVSLEHKILTSSKLVAKYNDSSQYNLILHPELADSLFKNADRSVFAYTTQKEVKTTIKNFGSYTGECLEYYNYLLDSQPFGNDDKVIFGSRYNLELVYKGNPEINSLLRSQYIKDCQDCPNSLEYEKVFAALKHVEGLYFTYVGTFPLDNKLNTVSRGLVMKMNDRLVYLWYAEVDLIGCSCI